MATSLSEMRRMQVDPNVSASFWMCLSRFASGPHLLELRCFSLHASNGIADLVLRALMRGAEERRSSGVRIGGSISSKALQLNINFLGFLRLY